MLKFFPFVIIAHKYYKSKSIGVWLPGLFRVTGFPDGSIRCPEASFNVTCGEPLPGALELPFLMTMRSIPFSSINFNGPLKAKKEVRPL